MCGVTCGGRLCPWHGRSRTSRGFDRNDRQSTRRTDELEIFVGQICPTVVGPGGQEAADGPHEC